MNDELQLTRRTFELVVREAAAALGAWSTSPESRIPLELQDWVEVLASVSAQDRLRVIIRCVEKRFGSDLSLDVVAQTVMRLHTDFALPTL